MSLFSSRREETVSALGEQALIREIQTWIEPVGLPAPEGIGDDCALIHIKTPGKYLLTTDGIIYRYHFDDTVTANIAGEKLIKRNISDIAAMGGTPRSGLLSIILSPQLKTSWLKGFYEGLARIAKRFSIDLVGGDIAEGPSDYFSAHMTLLGDVVRPVLRQQAKHGDSIWVTGALGGSILGHHLNFEPRLKEGKWLAQHEEVTAMIDITDGLAKDLPTLLQENQAARVELESVPISQDACKLAQQTGKTEIEHAFCDGEDYELLFTLKKSADKDAFKKNWDATFATQAQCIGYIDKGSSENPLIDAKTGNALPEWHGFEHISAS